MSGWISSNPNLLVQKYIQTFIVFLSSCLDNYDDSMHICNVYRDTSKTVNISIPLRNVFIPILISTESNVNLLTLCLNSLHILKSVIISITSLCLFKCLPQYTEHLPLDYAYRWEFLWIINKILFHWNITIRPELSK